MDRRRPDRRPAGGPHRRPGLSSRFDAGPEETKLVVPLFDKPLVRHVAEAALASRARPILVVTGHAAAQVEAALKNLDLSFISNPDYRTGLASALKTWIAALPDGRSPHPACRHALRFGKHHRPPDPSLRGIVAGSTRGCASPRRLARQSGADRQRFVRRHK